MPVLEIKNIFMFFNYLNFLAISIHYKTCCLNCKNVLNAYTQRKDPTDLKKWKGFEN